MKVALLRKILTCVLEARKEIYEKLLSFISADEYFSIDRLYGLLSSTGMRKAYIRWSRGFLLSLYRSLRGTGHSSRKTRSPRAGTGDLCLSYAGLHESRRVC